MSIYLGNRADSPRALPVWPGPSPSPVVPPLRPAERTLPNQSFVPPADRSRLTIAIDFGTTSTGVAYGSPYLTNGQVRFVLNWPGSIDTYRKIPTCLLYGEDGELLNWGLEAKDAHLPDEPTEKPLLPNLPYGKLPLQVIADFLFCIWKHAKEEITREIGLASAIGSADVWLIIPSTWNKKGVDVLQEAALQAGLIEASPGDSHWRDRLKIITDAEAASMYVYTEQKGELDIVMSAQSGSFLVYDAGGVALSITLLHMYKDINTFGLTQMAATTDLTCGSLLLDLRFRELMKKLMEDHPTHRDLVSQAHFMHQFSTVEKLGYEGEVQDGEFFDFTCFNVEDPEDPSVGLRNGAISLPGIMLRKEVFDPVLDQVIQHITDDIRNLGTTDMHRAICLVGGLAENPYLFSKVKQTFENLLGTSVHRPSDADTAVLRGAVRVGMTGRPLISEIYVPYSYAMKVRLPADTTDRQRRPAYIKDNGAGVIVCEKRLQYLLLSGGIRKSEIRKTRCTKFSKNINDTIFRARIFRQRGRQDFKRYTDEDSLEEVCKWTVDLQPLPHFSQNISREGGFYTEFELGIEVDTDALYGIIFYDEIEWARFEFQP